MPMFREPCSPLHQDEEQLDIELFLRVAPFISHYLLEWWRKRKELLDGKEEKGKSVFNNRENNFYLCYNHYLYLLECFYISSRLSAPCTPWHSLSHFLVQTLQPLTGKFELHIINGLHTKDPKNPITFHRSACKFQCRISFHASPNERHIKHDKGLIWSPLPAKRAA